jgi:hypothetical protein
MYKFALETGFFRKTRFLSPAGPLTFPRPAVYTVNHTPLVAQAVSLRDLRLNLDTLSYKRGCSS